MGCASEDAESLHEAVEALRRDGFEVVLCDGLDHDPRRLLEMIDHHAGRGLYVLCRSPRLARERVEELREILLARHVPFARTLTVAVGGRGALADRIRAGMRRASARASGPNRAVDGHAGARGETDVMEDEEPTRVGKPETGAPEELDLVASQPLPPPPRATTAQSPAAPRAEISVVEAVDADLLVVEDTSVPWTAASVADLDLSDLDEGNTGPQRAMRLEGTSVGKQPALITGDTVIGPAPAMITGDTLQGEKLPRGLREAAGRWPLSPPDGARGSASSEPEQATTPFPRMSMAGVPLAALPSSPPSSPSPFAVAPPPPPPRAAPAPLPPVAAPSPAVSVPASLGPSLPPAPPPPAAWASASNADASFSQDDAPVGGPSRVLPWVLGCVALLLLALVIALAVTNGQGTAEVTADNEAEADDAPSATPTPSSSTPARQADAEADEPPAAPAVYPVVAALEARKLRALDVLLVATSWGKPSNWSTAMAYCDGLDVEGIRGWRLPQIGELYSLAQANMLARGMFWSSTAADTFGDGHLAWNTRRGHALPYAEDAVAVCVRGEASGS
jgi:hypothetical protein